MASLTYENILRSRVEQIVKLFEVYETVSNQTISNDCGMHPSTTCRVMETLIRCGLCIRVHRGTYKVGFRTSGKDEYTFSIPGLSSEPSRARAVRSGSKIEWFWISDDPSLPCLQPFGCFTEVAGLVSKELKGTEVIEEWNKGQTSLWKRLRSYLRGGI